jgi:hypothetical protein
MFFENWMMNDCRGHARDYARANWGGQSDDCGMQNADWGLKRKAGRLFELKSANCTQLAIGWASASNPYAHTTKPTRFESAPAAKPW